MNRWLAFVAVVVLAHPAPAQPKKKDGPLSPADALAALKVADGFQVELFAAEPMLINPTSMDVDHKGRVWVAEAVNYRRKPPYNRPILRAEGDRIVVLVDETGEGKATKAVTFYQSPELYGPLGVCVAPYPDGKGQKVFVCQSPDILVFEDKDGDLKADGPPKKFLTNFRGVDHDHGVHGIIIGPDGKLYFTVGDSGVGGLQGADGKGKKWTSNDTDCQKGTVWRCDMDGGNLELIAHNFRNNYEACVNSFGEIWLSDNDDDGNQQTRICHVMPGGNYGYGPRGAGQSHWHEEQPGIVHKTMRTGFGSPTGITFYEGSLFPEKYRGQLLHCDAGPREVRWFHIKPKGAGYELTKEVLLTSSDNFFRPSDVCVAPDGSVIVADWYDRGVGGHGMGDPTDGRIYRVTPKGHKGYAVPDVNVTTNDGVVAAFASPSLASRYLGRNAVIECYRNDDPARPTARIVQELLGKRADPRLIARRDRAIHDSIPDARRSGLDKTFAGADGAYYLRLMSDTRGLLTADVWSPIAKADFSTWLPATRRELLLELKTERPETVGGVFYKLAQLYDGEDIFYRAALNIACGTDQARRDAILADFDKHFPEWNDKVADLVWELRPKSVLPRLGALLTDAKLTAAQKARVIDILAVNDDLAAGRTLLGVLKSDAPAEAKSRAIDNLKLFLPTKWKALQGSKELADAMTALLADAKTQATGLQLVAATAELAQLDAAEKIARDEKAPLDLRKEAVKTLGKLPSEKAVAALSSVGSPKNPLSVACIQALGELLPKGQKPAEYSARALEALQFGTLHTTATDEIRTACIEALAANRAGTIWLLEAHAKDILPKEFVPRIGQLVRNSPFQDLRNRALLAFPAANKLNPKKLPAIAELAKRTGNADRGKQVAAATTTGAAACMKCHMVRGFGGQIGPDLSMIGKKASKENLFESILLPSKAIADQYIQESITTGAGVTVSGLVVADTAQGVTLRDANGKDTVVPKNDIEARKKLQVSIMPEDGVAGLTEEELIDLVAYLQTLQTAALTPDSFQVVGPFAAKSMTDALDTAFPPEKGDASAEKAKTLRPDAKGYFDLAALHGNAAANSASYMFAVIESPADQDATVLLGLDDGGRLWLNGKAVHASRDTKAAVPEQHAVPVKLQKGKNSVVLKVANGNNPHGFFFTLQSDQETKTAK